MAESSELTLGWQGGLNSNLNPAYIGDDELSDMSNAICEDGTARLDRRYIKALEQQAGDLTPQGSGWGKYATGSQSEQYLAVLGTTLYHVDLTTTLAFTAVGGATGLTASDWWFAQFADYMYCGNATDGLSRKKLAAGSNGTGDYADISLPTAPTSAPTYDYAANYEEASFTGSSITASGSSSTSLASTGDWQVVYAAGGTYTVTITFDTSPDLRPNWEYRDILSQAFLFNGVTYDLRPQIGITDSGGATSYPSHWRFNLWRMQNVARSNRDVVNSLSYTFSIPAAGTLTFVKPGFGRVWLSLDSQTNPGDAYPTFKPLVYEYTYYNSTTGFESAPSPALTIAANKQMIFGDWFTISAPTTAESGVDNIRFYRVVTTGSTTTRYRLDTVANTGHPTTKTTVDKYPLDEVTDNATYTPSVAPASGITGMCAWQNRLVLAVGTLVYISRDGQPLVYEQQSGAFDIYNPARGLTFYPDDKRGEEIVAVVGQDDLYMVSKYSVRCLVGNSPDNWRLLKLPDSEGACGPRAVAPYKKGILVLTPSGRLLYHHSSLLEPELVSGNVDARVGNEGIKALATSTAVVTVRPDGEIVVTSTTGYYILSVKGKWRKGTYAHGVHSALSIPGIAPRWIGTNGKLYEGGSDSYVSDGGTTGTNGTAATWTVTGKKYLLQRKAVDNIFWGDSTESPTSGTPTLPKVDVITDRGTVSPVKRDGKYNKNVKITSNGYGFKFKIYGDKDVVVETVRVGLVDVGPGRHL